MPIHLLCWANAITPPEDGPNFIGGHAHQNEIEITFLSSNYCVTADKDTATVFEMPGIGDNEVHVQNKPGQLVLFPQWVDHWTTPFERENDVRITISADIDVGHRENYMWDEDGKRVHYLPLDSPPHVKAREEGIDVEEVNHVVKEIVEYINTPIDEIKKWDEPFDFSDINETKYLKESEI